VVFGGTRGTQWESGATINTMILIFVYCAFSRLEGVVTR
jgi:hypothetical protein